MPPRFASSRSPPLSDPRSRSPRDRKDILLSMHAIAGAYRRVLPNGLVIASARAEHAAPLESLQRVVFPTLADEERFKAAHYLKHFELFPAGQFVALDGDRVSPPRRPSACTSTSPIARTPSPTSSRADG